MSLQLSLLAPPRARVYGDVRLPDRIALRPKVQSIADAVRAEFEAHPELRITADDMAARLGKSERSVAPRMSELVADGFLELCDRVPGPLGVAVRCYRIRPGWDGSCPIWARRKDDRRG